jgi:hypothetical protein
LIRFLNYISNHQVLGKDLEVVSFLSYEGEWYNYRNSKSFIYEVEYIHPDITNEIIYKIPDSFDTNIVSFRTVLTTQLENVCKIIHILERQAKRLQETAEDLNLVDNLLTKTFEDKHCVKSQCNRCYKLKHQSDSLIDGLKSIEKSTTAQVFIINRQLKYQM